MIEMPRNFIRIGKPNKSESSVKSKLMKSESSEKGKLMKSEPNVKSKPRMNDFTSRSWSK